MKKQTNGEPMSGDGPGRGRWGLGLWWVRGWAVGVVGLVLWAGVAGAADREKELRAYVAQCVADAGIFVCNPPAELRAYADLTPEELEKRQKKVMRDGAMLILYPNGLPAKLETRADFKPHGPAKTWYADGTVQTDEVYDREKLRQGKYYGEDGRLLAEVKDGTGRQLEFDREREGRKMMVRRESAYRDGVKEGREVTYYGGKVRGETYYRNGLKNGTEKMWMESGQLNTLANFVAGKQEGVATCWYENGVVQSQMEYKDGRWLGGRIQYYKNGQMSEESLMDGEALSGEMRWYPEGALMWYKVHDAKTHRVARAESFDRAGARNGEVRDGSGQLVGLADNGGEERFPFPAQMRVERYRDGAMTSTPLPSLRWSSSGEMRDDAGVSMTFAPQDKAGGLEVEKCEIFPPGGETIVYEPGSSTEVKIPLPGGYRKWVGAVYGRTTVKGGGGPYEFIQVVWAKEKERPAAPERPETAAEREKPRMMYLRDTREPVKAGDLTLPSLSKAVLGWSMRGASWLLYAEPAVLLQAPSERGPWRVVARYGDRPVSLVLLGKDHVIVLRTKATKTPERGIPYVVEETRDGGKTWQPFAMPPVDYPLGLGVQNGILLVSGIRLPKGGLPEGKEWFELPRTTFLSDDEGKHFTQMVGPSFFDIGMVQARSVAPDGQHRAYLMNTSFQDTSYQILLADRADTVPRMVAGGGTILVPRWAPGSDFLGFEDNGKLINLYNLKTGQIEVPPQIRVGKPTDKELGEQAAWEQKAQSLLQGGKTGWDNLKEEK
ncbi:hypothetical protein BH09VER1_BH09VER1_46030 [soil metagenome]